MSDMYEKVKEFLEGLPVTIVSAVALIASFIISETGVNFPFDLAWISLFCSGIPILCEAVESLFYEKGIARISSELLVSSAMVASVLIGDLFAAGEVAFIMALGELLEDYTTERARKGLKRLVSVVPKTGTRLADGKELEIPVSEIKEGDILRVKPGESIPADAVVIDGNSSVDQSILTGESLPVDKKAGDSVFCGSLNCFGSIDIKVTHTGEDSSLQRLIRTVTEAEEKQAPMQRTADRYASIFVPVALLIAICAYIFTGEIIRAVTVLVVFCPCALVLATPTAIMAAIGQAAKHGVVIKSGEALEKMGKLRTVAFDKTGTLTVGKPGVSNIMCIDPDFDGQSLISAAASCESRSEHPLAKAIVQYAKEQQIALKEVSSFDMRPGYGIEAVMDGKTYVLGNSRLMEEKNIVFPERIVLGGAVVLVACNGRAAGVITLSDKAREDSAGMITELGKMGLKTVLLTGDNSITADYIASETGIADCRANLLPHDKLDEIEKLRKDGTVCMIGDGINDAPALKCADIGIAMGQATDIAAEAADIVLVGNEISKIPYLIKLSFATLKTIKAGITLSMVINIVAVTLSVMGLLNPTAGALVHNAGSFLVVAIAALLYDRKFK